MFLRNQSYPSRPIGYKNSETIFGRISHFSLFFTIIVMLICCVSVGLLYSVSGGDFSPWASSQLIRLFIGMTMFLIAALIPIKWVFNSAYVFHFFVIILLVMVLFSGQSAGGAQRWLTILNFSFQPSEVAKISLVMLLARYYTDCERKNISHPLYLLFPLSVLLLTCYLISKQPDLGTSIMIAFSGVIILYAVGINKYYFIVTGAIGLISVPILWSYLKGYQKERIIGFLNPESDPLGNGYHIIQSKIALGSGGLYGKGFLKGTQTQLNFIPEKHTDFILTMLGEEFGYFGIMILLTLYFSIIIYSFVVAYNARSIFGRLLAIVIASNFSVHIFVNMAMVAGLLPVVGIPLPLVSFGGTALVTQLLALGLVMNVSINRRHEL